MKKKASIFTYAKDLLVERGLIDDLQIANRHLRGENKNLSDQLILLEGAVRDAGLTIAHHGKYLQLVKQSVTKPRHVRRKRTARRKRP
jgi:hypothetical protein